MFRFVLALALAVASASTGLAAEPSLTKADAAYGVRYTEEHVANLPQDSQMPFLSVYGSTSDARFNQIVGWFNTNPQLIELKNHTHFNVTTAESTMYERYARSVPGLPCVMFQTADGGRIMPDMFGAELPMSSDALFHALNSHAAAMTNILHGPWNNDPANPDADCFRRRGGGDRYAQPDHGDPQPQPLPAPLPPLVDHRFPLGLVLLLCLIGGGFGLSKGWNERFHKRSRVKKPS